MGMSRGRFQRWFVDPWIQVCVRHYGLLALLSLAVMAGALSTARQIRLDSDLQSLLPKESPVVVQMNEIRTMFGGAQDMVIALFGAAPDLTLKAGLELQRYLDAKDERYRSVRIRTPKEFLTERKYQLVPLESLKALHRRVLEERKKHPFLNDPLGLEEESEPPEIADSQAEERDLAKAKEMLARLDSMPELYRTKDGGTVAIRVVPRAEGLNIGKNRELIRQLEADIREFNLSRFDTALGYEIHGSIPRYVARYESILADLTFGGWGILLILLLVVAYFQTLWCWVPLVPPLVFGLASGLAVVRWKEESLNSIAVFLVLVIFGVGIEFGIHLWARYVTERRTSSAAEALRLTWASTGRASVTSAVALLCGFAILTFSSFQGFAQFGRVALVLVSSTALGFLLTMPAWVLVTERLRGQSTWPRTLSEWADARIKSISRIRVAFPVLRWIGGGLIVAGAGISLGGLRFDYEFDEGVRKRTETKAELDLAEIFTERVRPNAVAVFETSDAASRFVEFYRVNEDHFPEIPMVTALSLFFPNDLKARTDLLVQIANDFERRWLRRIEDDVVRNALSEIKENAPRYTLFELNDVPPELREPFIASDGSGRHLVYIFDVDRKTDGRKAMRFSDAVVKLAEQGGGVSLVSGDTMIFADVVRRVVSEGPYLVLGMFLLVALTCWLDFRRWWETLVTMAPVLSGFLLTGGVMVLTGLQINFYNMVALASLGAMVVDNSIHLFHRFAELRESEKTNAAVEAGLLVGPTVATCTLTSISGYGGMAVATHVGIASLGQVAVLGLALCFLSAVLLFPPWLALLERRRRG